MERWQELAMSAVRHFRKRTAHWSLHDVEVEDIQQQAVAETLAVLCTHHDATDAYVVWLVARRLMQYVLRNVWDVPTIDLAAAQHVMASSSHDDYELHTLPQLIAKLAATGRVKGGERGRQAIAQTVRVLELLAEGYTITRIADLLQLTPSAVRQLLARLRKRLETEQRLKKECVKGERYVA